MERERNAGKSWKSGIDSLLKKSVEILQAKSYKAQI
jgi:hypothetical protein